MLLNLMLMLPNLKLKIVRFLETITFLKLWLKTQNILSVELKNLKMIEQKMLLETGIKK